MSNLASLSLSITERIFCAYSSPLSAAFLRLSIQGPKASSLRLTKSISPDAIPLMVSINFFAPSSVDSARVLPNPSAKLEESVKVFANSLVLLSILEISSALFLVSSAVFAYASANNFSACSLDFVTPKLSNKVARRSLSIFASCASFI